MSFDCILFGAGHAGTVVKFDGAFVETVVAPSIDTKKNASFNVTKHNLGGLDYAVGIHPEANIKVAMLKVDSIIQAKSVEPLP